VNDTTLIASFFPAAEETEALKLTNAITIEAWVKPLDALQGGPARMVTLSGDPSNRNFTLGQAGDAYDVRLRTTLTDLNGTPSVASPAGTASPNLMHVVYTRDASGQVKLYIDSVEQTSSAVGGDFSNWDSAYRFALANEFSLDRPWLGEFHLVAIYDRALSPAEIGQNFLAGPTGTGSTPGRKSASLLISSNDPDQGQMYLSLTGNAVPNPVPDIAVNPTAVDFGATLLNSTASQSVVIHNEGTVDLQINSIALGGANAGEFSVDNSGPATIAAGESLTVAINFTPTSEGAKSASLAISSNDPDEAALNVALQGSGGLPDISVTPTAYSYGTVTIGQTATHGFTITNAGTFDLEVATISLLGTNASEFSVSIGGEFVLAPGQSQAVDVNFSPGSEGAKTATLRIESNDPDENPLDVVVSGNAVTTPIPDIAVNPTSHDFGDVQVDQASNQMVEVSNVGAADLNVTSIAITGADSTDFSVADTTPFTLAAGASKTMEVSFTPHTVGTKSAALRLESNDPDENPLAVDLTGNATTTSAANIAATPTSYDFGVLNVGETATHSFFISNDGASDLQVTGVSITGTNADQFAVVSGGGTFTLTPGQNREIQVLFNPTTFSAKSAILRIESNDANDNPLDIQLSGYLNTPPPMPLLVYPAYEDTADVLKWSRSNDPDNGDQITYTIEILSNQPTFRAETQDTSMTIDEIAQSFNLIDGTFYFWRVKASDNHGAASDFSPLGKFLYVANTVTGVKDDRSTNPTSFRLAQNFPNPFNPTTQIDYELPARANVTLAIYDIRGRLVRRLLDGEDKPSGTHSVFWDGKDASGNSVSSGVYFYAIRISAAETGKTFVQTKKMTLLK
ncbi:MAG: choice-of-anchor D domain-containing protein, partial [Calditrichaeota bacterium]